MQHSRFISKYSLAATLLLCSALPHCKQSTSTEVQSAPDQTYTVRGKIVVLPSNTAKTLELQHEAIPAFVNAANVQVGMPAMTMPFNVAHDVSLDSFARGDLVTLRFEVRWNSEPQLLVREMSKLPAGTTLDL